VASSKKEKPKAEQILAGIQPVAAALGNNPGAR
jgi:hypothetical protein